MTYKNGCKHLWIEFEKSFDYKWTTFFTMWINDLIIIDCWKFLRKTRSTFYQLQNMKFTLKRETKSKSIIYLESFHFILVFIYRFLTIFTFYLFCFLFYFFNFVPYRHTFWQSHTLEAGSVCTLQIRPWMLWIRQANKRMKKSLSCLCSLATALYKTPQTPLLSPA